MVIIDIPSALLILPLELEIEKDTLLLVISYHMPGHLGTFLDRSKSKDCQHSPGF